jgi:Tol biopolymer transport system component/DNA-binding winged helix-turn-helix (wHTH) protein
MSAQPQLVRRCLRFGVFELNTVTGELRKNGVRVRLQDQPLKLLLCLLDTPGEIFNREDLIRRIWPEGTFVDYEHGLNAAVTRLRQVMGDSADTPRYVETVGRKGYRFIAPVELIPVAESVPPAREEIDGRDTGVAASQAPAGQPALSWLWPSVAVLAIALAAVAAVGWWRATRPVPQPLVRLSVDLGSEITAEGGGPATLLALSPGGTRLAVAVRGPDGKTRLATRRLDESRVTLLPGTEGAGSPFFSPDGAWIAFFVDGDLKKIAAQGGAPVMLLEAATHAKAPSNRFHGSWGDDGNIIAELSPAAGLTRIPSAGGPPATPLIGLAKGKDERHTWPQVLPGSQAVLFTATAGASADSNIEVFSFKTGIRKTVLSRGALGRYLPSGHLVYISQNKLFAVPFDLSRLTVAGTPQPVLEDIGTRLGGWNFDFSRNGSFVYFSQNVEAPHSIFWLDTAGRALPLQPAPGPYRSVRLSPDGKRLAYSTSARGHEDIWVQDLDSGTPSRLTALPGINDAPVWTADGWNLIFRSTGQPNPGIYGVRADGSGQPERLLDLRTGAYPSSVSPDGKLLALWDQRAGGTIWTAPVDSSRRNLSLGKAETFLQTPFNPAAPARTAPAFSPDGRWLAYCSNESGQLEVYVVPFPGPGAKTRISTGGGKFPRWSRSGRELFFLDFESNKIMATSYKETGDSFVAAKPQMWSGKRLLEVGEFYYDIALDGKRFAAILYPDGTAEQKPATSLTFLLNFFDELRRRVPAARNNQTSPSSE